MTPEEQLYTLMAQAEDLQQHAQTLQSRAKTALEGLPEIVRETGSEIRAQAMRWIVIVAAVIVALGVVVAGGVSAYIRYDVGSLRDKADALRAEISTMEKTAAELQSKTWRLELATWKEERGIILPRGVTAESTATMKDGSGRIVVIIKP